MLCFNFIYLFRASNLALTLNKWQHFAMTLKGNMLSIYIDGVSCGSATANQPRAVTRTTVTLAKATGLAMAQHSLMSTI